MGSTIEGSEFESRYGQEFSLLQIVQTGSEVHPTPIQWVPGALCPGVKRPGREVDHSPPTSARSRKCGSIHPLPIRLHDVVLNLLSTGTTLVFIHCVLGFHTREYEGYRLVGCDAV
jgi:hypothetical protein